MTGYSGQSKNFWRVNMEKAKLSDTTVSDEKLIAIRKWVEVIDKVDNIRADCPSDDDEVNASLNEIKKIARKKLHEWTTCSYCCGWDEDDDDEPTDD